VKMASRAERLFRYIPGVGTEPRKERICPTLEVKGPSGNDSSSLEWVGGTSSFTGKSKYKRLGSTR